ncbi:MAG: hypothetical protein WAS21_30415 [Geminicoccaceae bacterium]
MLPLLERHQLVIRDEAWEPAQSFRSYAQLQCQPGLAAAGAPGQAPHVDRRRVFEPDLQCREILGPANQIDRSRVGVQQVQMLARQASPFMPLQQCEPRLPMRDGDAVVAAVDLDGDVARSVLGNSHALSAP